MISTRKTFKHAVLLAVLAAAGSSAMAAEITFQSFERDLGQDVNTVTPILGDEWLSFGIDMVGPDLFVYGPPNQDPFPDNNGVFENAAGSFEIVFNEPVTNLEIDWFSTALIASTIVAFDPGGNAIQVEINPGGAGQDTELFTGTIKRIVVQADPGTLCISNLRFDVITALPTMQAAGLAATFALLLAAMLAVRRRAATSS